MILGMLLGMTGCISEGSKIPAKTPAQVEAEDNYVPWWVE